MAAKPIPSRPIRECQDCGGEVCYLGSGQPPKRCPECQVEIGRKRARECYRQRRDRLVGSQPVERKSCTRCGEEKTASSFALAKGRTDGLQSWCRQCVSEYQRANREALNERSRRFRQRRPKAGAGYVRKARNDVLAHYSTTSPPSCACCGESEPAFLVLDHVLGGGTAHRKEIKGSIWFWLRSRGYPDGYQVLCWNCNAAKAYEGICPHQVGKVVALCAS